VARAVGEHRNLLNVDAAVDTIGDQIGNRDVGRIDRDPGEPAPLVPDELVEGERIVVGDLPHTDVVEALAGRPLDVLQNGQLVHTRGSNVHGFIVQDDWAE
jgi:hypothetical protein